MNRAFLLAALGLASAWMALVLGVVRPDTLVHDWHGWRQADTQTIALNYARGGVDLLHPRIAWGGDGPGFVEAELQVLPALTAPLLRLFPAAEWPGRVVSAVALALTSLVLMFWLRRSVTAVATLAGGAVFLTSQGTQFLVSVQPDALGLLFATAAFVAFWRWTRDPSRRAVLVASGLLLAVAGAIKPTFLGVGLCEVLYSVVAARPMLKRVSLWVHWFLVLLAVAAWLAWASTLHRDYGNTFGVISGGDSKFPTLHRLLSPGQYLGLARVGLEFGPGWLGVSCLVIAAVRRRFDPVLLALSVGYVSVGLVALRYASESWLGSHYHALGLVVGAVAVARALDGLSVRAAAPAFIAALLTLGIGLHARTSAGDGMADREIAAGRALLKQRQPGERVIVRSNVESVVPGWGGTNNYEDPRVFYLAGATGWVLPSDRWDISEIEALWKRGAVWYVDTTGELDGHPEVHAFLARHAVLEVTDGPLRLYRFVTLSPMVQGS